MDQIENSLKQFLHIELVAALFAIIALIMLVILSFRSSQNFMTQIVGSLLVVAITLYADETIVYVIAVFVVATLVTELEFLEKIAALIWNRKEYWSYLQQAIEKEVENKVEQDAEEEFQLDRNDGIDEVESEDETVYVPEGLTDINSTSTPQDRSELVKEALRFEQNVLENLTANKIPFAFEDLKKEVKITSRFHHYIVDAIIETPDTHFLLEIKNTHKISSLDSAREQLNSYTHAYRKFLSERRINVIIQPLIVVPYFPELPDNLKGIPVVKFDSSSKRFLNLQNSYPEYAQERSEITHRKLDELLLKFLKGYSKWAFSPLRIRKWGAKQSGYGQFSLYSTAEIKYELEELVKRKKVKTTLSKKGNILYKIID